MGREEEDLTLILGPDQSCLLANPEFEVCLLFGQFHKEVWKASLPHLRQGNLCNSSSSKDVFACGLLSMKGYFWLCRDHLVGVALSRILPDPFSFLEWVVTYCGLY